MITASLDIEIINGQPVLIVIPAETGERVDIPLTDEQSANLQEAGVQMFIP